MTSSARSAATTAPVEDTDSRPSRRRNRLSGRPGPSTYLLLTAIVVLSAFPFYWMFIVASNSTEAINDVPPAMIPGGNFFDHVADVFARVPMGMSLVNSAIVATTIAVSQTVLCALAGFAFAKLRFRGRRTLFWLVVGTMMVPTQLGVIPQFIIVSELGWTNNLLSVIVPSLVTAFGVFWMRQHIGSAVPDEVIQAARVDGASNLRVFRSVVLPMIRPAAAVLALFSFMAAWNDFFWPLIVLQKPESYTAQVALRQIQNQAYVTDYGVQMAGTVIATLPLLIVAIILGKQLVAGIMEGAVKG